jgi:dephospho-CoA kinase
MRWILVTGMSGTGKSTALAELRRHGFEVVDTDEPGWTEWSEELGDVVAELIMIGSESSP